MTSVPPEGRWLAECTGLFLAAVDALPDGDFGAPSLLPGWTRHHVIAHVHFNALALGRLVSWAGSGVESRMYEGPEQRAAEIERGATIPPSALRGLARRSAEDLDAAMTALHPDAWRHEVVTARGRTVAASQIPWMRTREVAVHAIDLATGTDFADLPGDLLREISTEAVAMRSTAGDAAAVTAWLTGRPVGPAPLAAWL